MATRNELDAAIARYYDAWTRNDAALFADLWAEGATVADPPSDDEPPLTGRNVLLEHFASVQGMFDRLSYDQHQIWHAGHAIAVHSTVTGHETAARTDVPIIHTFRFDPNARIQHLDAFMDSELAVRQETA